MLPVLFHFLCSVMYIFTIYYDQNYAELPTRKEFIGYPFRGRIMLLTFWCLFLQCVYYPIALLNDIIEAWLSPSKTQHFRKFRELLFTIVYPLSTYVSLTFWIVYFVDKRTVFPPDIERATPIWMNHVTHTSIIIIAQLELLNIIFPSKKVWMLLSVAFNLAYVIWYIVVFFKTGAWVYPFFVKLNWPIRVLFFIMSILVSAGIYLIGDFISHQIPKIRGKKANYVVR